MKSELAQAKRLTDGVDRRVGGHTLRSRCVLEDLVAFCRRDNSG